VVLVRPQEEGNIGAAARAMANMGLDRLILVEPAAAIGSFGRAMAVRAGEILERAERVDSLRRALEPFQRVIGTTSTRDRALTIPLLAPRDLAPHITAGPPLRTALVFGPEVSGLSRDELALCNLLVRIPSALPQPTLNLAQAVLILAYELYLVQPATPPDSESIEPPAPAAEIEGLFAHMEPLLAEVGFARDDTFTGVLRDLRQLAARAAPTSRDIQILRGICRRAERTLEQAAVGPNRR